jgi:hypothetical protein
MGGLSSTGGDKKEVLDKSEEAILKGSSASNCSWST